MATFCWGSSLQRIGYEQMKIGILGLGSIGKRHATNLVTLGHQIMGYDPSPEWAVERGWSYNRDDVLCDSDAIVIASPTSEHKKDLVDTQIIRKPVFLEKPVAGGHCVIRHPYVLMVGYNLRFHGVVKKAKEWLPKIGQPLWAQFWCAQYNAKPVYLRDGVILNWSHEIDLALYLLGHGRCTSASSNECESLADINILHCSGCRSSVHLDYLTEPERRGFRIVGTEAEIRGVLAKPRYCSFIPNNGPGDVADGNDSYDENYVEEMQAFLDRIEGKETIGATYQDGMDVLEVCLDAKCGRWQG